MRSLGAVALILAVITECFGAQSDRSRHRSSAFRSVPVGASIKRDVDFDCPEEFGYYPHPTDCTQYYVCVFGGALLESCTGGLMYSHELQTCDWPRNVGCDGVSAVGGEELERISEREPPSPPPPPPPRRTPPPPPPRAQPNPVVTSRGQPKFNREEYEKQQQLYAEVDDLPPVEEIESDRQQRVYRGQPSTIGQVQKDRDGYSQISSGRNLNPNIIPASISQNNGKIGSFSFGTQVDERRASSITQAPQRYSENKRDNVTDTQHDRQLDIETNEIDITEVIEKPLKRRKRDLNSTGLVLHKTNSSADDTISDRVSNDEEMEYVEFDVETMPTYGDERGQDDSERGKRQIRYYLKNGYKTPGKSWAVPKQIKLVDLSNLNYNPSSHNIRPQVNYNVFLKNSNVPEVTQKPLSPLVAPSTSPFQFYQSENFQGQKAFKPSLPDPTKHTFGHNSANIATQIITKSPPISALTKNENPFSFYDNTFNPNGNSNNNHYSSSYTSFGNQPNSAFLFPDSTHLSSSVVTGKPILTSTSPRTQNQHQLKPQLIQNNAQPQINNHSPGNMWNNQKPVSNKPPLRDEEYDEDEESSENQSSEDESVEKDEEDSREHFKHNFPDPPYEFTHPHNTFKNIENPFANPNFNFDAYLAKLSGGQYTVLNSQKPKTNENRVRPIEVTTASSHNSGIRSSPLNYKGMSTPRPFNGGDEINLTVRPDENKHNIPLPVKQNIGQWSQKPSISQHQQYNDAQEHQHSLSQNIYQVAQQTAGIPLEAVKPKLKPPNFKDDRQLPISYSFSKPILSSTDPNYNTHNLNLTKINYKPTNGNEDKSQVFTGTPKPYVVITGTGSPIILSTPKQQYLLKQEKVHSVHPHLVATSKPYLLSSVKPHNAYITFKQSTSKPLTTLANEHLSALQHYWGSASPSPESYFSIQSSIKPSNDLPKLENLFSTSRPSAVPMKNPNYFNNVSKDQPISSSTSLPPKRRPIPKPSPEMNDYYYDEDEDDEQYYYEPPVKPKYMPSTEVRPQRPPMAQNYKEYDDSYEEINHKPHHTRKPTKFTSTKPDTITKNYNDVSVVTKSSIKDLNKNVNGKIPIPVMVNYATPPTTVLMRPEISNYEIIHHAPRSNKTIHIRKPVHSESGPFTPKPPKYLNQTTLRPYTVRHRLAKPTTVNHVSNIVNSNRMNGRTRHQNIVAQTIHTTPRDNHKQETRYTKTKHDDKTNSLEPTESVSPISYSASPRPKMLYNGSQTYNPDQYDPFYAIYDEDGELYKDTDYVQQYNTASLRPAVQQTYRGTPPPSRRPVETYTPRPVSADDYDDALIQGQINNQNQYQSPIRHSTRGDGNELGYDHNPSSVRTTIYEATSISTTPTTTSTSTTTQRTTSAPLTEAMIPSRYTVRSSTDENPIESSEPSQKQNPSDGSIESDQSTALPTINLSSLAKPFERTDNSHRLSETLLSTERSLTSRHFSRGTNHNNLSLDVVHTSSEEKSQGASLTSGFSIRRNLNNTNNPYTLTVLTRPFNDYNKSRRANISSNNRNKQIDSSKYYQYDTDNYKGSSDTEKTTETNHHDTSSEVLIERKDSGEEIQNDDDTPIYITPKIRKPISKTRIYITTEPTTTPSSTTKYYLKTVVRRPTPFAINNGRHTVSTESSINTDAIIDAALENSGSSLSNQQSSISYTKEDPKEQLHDRPADSRDDITVSPYRSFDNFRSALNNRNSIIQQSTTTTSTTQLPSASPKTIRLERPRSKPSYYTYRVLDEIIPDQTTEVFSGKVKQVLKAFFSNLASTPKPRLLDELSFTTSKPTPLPEEKVVNIGFQKKMLKYVDEKPLRQNVQRLQIITEPSVNQFIPPNEDILSNTESEQNNGYSSTLTLTSAIPSVVTEPPTTPVMLESSTNTDYRKIPSRQSFESKFNRFATSKPNEEMSSKFQKLLFDPSTERSNYDSSSYINIDDTTTKQIYVDSTKNPTESDWDEPVYNVFTEIASTTSTTKATSTVRIEPTLSTKSLSFPTRASRVNPAIKLAATNPGGGRRSYQTPSKCASDNSLQANPKCNEIKYQRPSSTRGRGSAHYSTGSDAPQPVPNRGTPPTRSRPTLKPSTSIVSKTTEFVDIYAHPPSRSAPVYPQPTPDKTAAKCRKDVCLLPDCYCGGKEIPGDLPLETVPQIVLLTFDDSVNDLNKGLYMDLFEKGRVNPNGCPISATFYVSHEWTDYSQVQNLYAAGHEMASHTVSHSFGEQFSQKKWNREVGGQREILAAYGGVKLEDVRGMRAPFLSVGGNKMFKMLYDSNFTYDSSLPVYENRPPSWPYTLDYKLFHDCMIPPCPTKSYPGVWEVPMVMWQDLNGGRCSMGDACANPPDAEGVYKMILKNFDRHYTTNRAPFGLYYHAAWFTQPHHKEGFIMFLDFINQMSDVWIVTNWQALQWVRDPTPVSRLNNFQPFQCNYQDRPKKCNNPKVCNLWHKSGVRYMRTCQPCPEIYPWTGKTGIKSSRIDNDIGE